MSEIEIEEEIVEGLNLNNKYILIKKIGSGTFSTVWFSYDFVNNKFYAIKVQLPEYFETGEVEVEVFEDIKKIKCESVINLVDHFIYEDVYICMVLELMAGSTYDLVRKGKYCHGLPPLTVKRITRQVLEGMDALRRIKLFHSDIKPENVLICGISDDLITLINKIKNFNFMKRNGENIKIILNKVKGKKNIKVTQAEAIKKTTEELLKVLKTDYHDNEDIEIEHMCNKFPQRNRACYYSEDDLFKNIDIHNIKTKLSDMGTTQDITYKDHDIQTRYYRSPEVLLKYKMNDTCDIWSLGCMIYELITGEIMFEPDKQIGFNRNRYHIDDIQKIFGPIPKDIIDTIEDKDIMFRQNYLLKNKLSLKHIPLSALLKSKLNNSEFTETDDFYQLCDLLYNMFNYDTSKRYNIKQCMDHVWLKNITV